MEAANEGRVIEVALEGRVIKIALEGRALEGRGVSCEPAG